MIFSPPLPLPTTALPNTPELVHTSSTQTSSSVSASTSEAKQSTTLLSLPPEILVQILLHLASESSSLLATELTCNYLHRLIQGSLLLQYEVALAATQQVDNPLNLMTVREKMAWLEESESRWRVLNIDHDLGNDDAAREEGVGRPRKETNRIRKIKVAHVPSGIYDLTGGVYLLGDQPRKALYWVKLPGREEILNDAEMKWNKIDVEEHGPERNFVDIGLCIYEHDLIAIVTISPRPTPDGSPPTDNDIDLLLLQFSTGLPHPHLSELFDSGQHQTPRQNYVRHIFRSPTDWQKPVIWTEIVGDHIVLIISYRSAAAPRPDDRVYVWDWRSGVEKMSFTAPYRTYSGLLFLTPSHFLLPNTQTNTLDIFRIPDPPALTSVVDRKSPEPVLSLSLPLLAAGRNLGSVSCRAEPNPVGYLSNFTSQSGISKERAATDPTRPFLPSARNALCIFSLLVVGGANVPDVGGGAGNPLFSQSFMFVVHRNALVDLLKLGVDKWSEGQVLEVQNTSPNVKEDGMPEGIEVGPPLPWFSQDPDQRHRAPARLSYASWGPPVTRWFNTDGTTTRWITTTSGQRLVLAPHRTQAFSSPYAVFDFCPHSVRKLDLTIKHEARRREEELQTMLRAREKMIATSPAGGGEKPDGEPPAHEDPYDHSASPSNAATSMPTASSSNTANTSSEFEAPVPASELTNPVQAPPITTRPSPPLLLRRLRLMASSGILESFGFFSEPIHGSLPYVACASEERYRFGGVLIDEERVVGIGVSVFYSSDFFAHPVGQGGPIDKY
ncbi:hypothetical protein GALMADRAFT_137139 [Galerina marginata CBS 339.88]|uniref:F-box domain-containing protein n=1 Tax=Galerina marginata (strain CBS 339.88) TaxID=685588 RepID=A0A067TH80_GALM3|nr:hypothetical protein GALMADRAFT_137139 [Galerina marginata CBS 339.88]